MQSKGTELFVKALQEEGVDIIFGYPGGYAVDLFDELYKQEEIKVILPRHEQALIHAADGYARSTGKVGVCLVTSGPGATNLVTGIATANYDSVPLVCFTGQVPTDLIGNDAFQEVDIVGITRSICKYGITVTDRKDLGRIIKEAFYIARTGKPGPVVIDLPKNVMLAMGEAEYPKKVNIRGYKPNTCVHVGQLKRAVGMLKLAKKPVFLIGGGVNIAGAHDELTKLVEMTKIPVITTIMGRGAIDTSHPYYMGNIGLHGSYACNQAVSECDLLFSIGTRFNDRITGKISEFAKNAKIVHIDIDTASISRNIVVDVPIVADAKAAIEKMIELIESDQGNKEGKKGSTQEAVSENSMVPDAESMESIRMKWLVQIRQWESEVKAKIQEAKQNMKVATNQATNQAMNQVMIPDRSQLPSPQEIMAAINESFDDVIIVTDVGQHQMWATQCLEMTAKKKLLTSGGLGTMGYGFPAAIGAQFAYSDRQVICISGDGGMQMNIQELATAVAWEQPLILCVLNNGYLGMVRQVQHLFYENHYSSTCLRFRKSCEGRCSRNCTSTKQCPPYTPDFVKLAESYGATGIRVTNREEIKKAFESAKNHKNGPTLIEFVIDPECLVLPMIRGGKALNDMITVDC